MSIIYERAVNVIDLWFSRFSQRQRIPEVYLFHILSLIQGVSFIVRCPLNYWIFFVAG